MGWLYSCSDDIQTGLIMQYLFILFLTFVSDVHAEIWDDLNITAEHYYQLSGFSGMATGFIFSLSIILILLKR